MVKNSRLQVGARWRWDGTLGFYLGLAVFFAAAPLAVAQSITPDGRTATSVTTLGAVTDVRTSTLQGGNAFNSFSTFSVPALTTTNLHVPGGAANLVNIVRDQRTTVDGLLNAVQDGRIGGNVWFANPFGFVVGAGGVVNVGSLNVSTPTQQFVDTFFTAPGLADAGAVSSLLAGTAPRSGTGLISIQGTVNAINGVNLSAGTVNVGGVVYAGARFVGQAPDFTDVVNANGLSSASHVVVEGGRIRIAADGDVTVGGTIAAPGAAGVKAGDISIRAGGDIDVQAGARIVARGYGAGSDGGTISTWADRHAVNRAGSLLDASAGDSGAGGFVEFSARDTIELAGGELRADGTGGGAGGKVLIDPANILVSANMLRGAASYASGPGGSGITVNGADLTLQASSGIDIASGVIVSSRSVATPGDANAHLTGASTGASGSITLQAPSIVLRNGSALLAHADSGFAAGDISLQAEQRASSNLMGIRDATASIQVGDASGGATLRGRDVTLSAFTSVDTRFYYSGSAPVENDINLGVTSLDQTALAGQAAAFGLSLLGINVVHSQSTGTASVVVRGSAGSNSVIEGTGSVALRAENEVSSGITTAAPPTPGAQVPSPLGLGALYATTRANATVDVQSTATIKGGNFSAIAHNEATVEGRIKAGSTNSSSNQLSIAFGYTSADVDASATIARGATIKSTGTVTLAATNYSKLTNEVESVTGPNGQASAAVAWSDHNTRARADLQADIGDARQVQVLAVDHVLTDQTTATASVGTGAFSMVKNALKQETVQGLEDFFWKRFGLETPKIDPKASPLPTPFRIGGAIAYVDSVHGATASIGENAKIHASDAGGTGAVQVSARTVAEKTVIAADTETSSPSIQAGGTPASGSPSRINVAAGLALGNFRHDASAVVGRNAEITADKIAVSSDVVLPIRPSILFGTAEWNFDRWDGLDTFSQAADTLNFLDVMNGKSSAQVAGSSDESSFGFSGSANILSFSHTSQAEVQEGARLNIRSGSTGGFNRSFTLREQTADTYDPITGTILLFRGDAADVQNWTFAAPVTVQANTDATLLFQAGAPQLAIGGSNKAIGFALSQVAVDGTTEAVVRENVAIRGVTDSAGAADADGARAWTVTSTTGTVDDVRVAASSTEKVFSFGASAGKASSGGNPVALNGIVTLVDVDKRTTASVDDEASVAARKLAIGATDETVAWSIAGAVNLSSSTAVGIGLGINDVTTQTRAEIADNDSYSLTNSPRASQGSYGATIKARDLDVEARTGGRVEAIGIAGSVSNAGSTPAGAGFFDKAGAAYQAAASDLTANLLGLSAAQPTRDRSNATTTKPPASSPPTFGLSGAGSAAVNITDMDTVARIEGVTVDMGTASPTPASLSVRAVSDADITAASGSAAITRAANPSQTRAVGVSGAVAVNMIGNGTEAVIKGSQVTGAKDVQVQALTGGEQLAVGIGAAITVTPETQPISSLAVAGSVSITLSPVDGNGDPDTYAKARIEGSTVTGDGSADADLDVTAYSRTFIGTGGGSLSYGGKTGVGAAVTYSDVRRDVEARVSGSTISQFETVQVTALNATEIGAGGAVAAVSDRQDAQALAGAFVITRVQNRTTAAIDGRSSVTAAGRIDVVAREGGPDSALESVIDPSGERAHVADGLDYCGRQAGVGAGGGGSCITSIAGLVQSNSGGNSSNLGISFVQNLIGNTVSARVEDSVLVATGPAGAVNVLADSSTHMLGVALGVGKAEQFSGAGSVVVSQTQNQVSASVTAPAADLSHRTVSAATVTVKASDASRIDSVAGQAVRSSDQTAIGAAISYNDIDNDVSARADGVRLNATNAVQVEAAQDDAGIRSLAIAGALAGGQGAFTASISVNQVTNETDARLVNTITADGAGGTNTVEVRARDKSSIEALAGNVSVGKSAGGGAAFAYNAIDNETLAQGSGSQLTEASAVDVVATQDASIRALTAAVGYSGEGNALAGSVSTNFIGNDTTAQLLSTGITGSTASVTVKAHDTSAIESASGGAALAGGSVGAGVAASVNRIANTADAHVFGVADANVRHLVIDAKSDATIETVAVALGAAGSLGIGGSNATNLMDNSTRAYIAGGARVLAEGNVGVFARNDDRAKVIAGALGASTGAAGAGVSVVVNMMEGTTDAHIDGAATRVDARGALADTLTANTGTLANPVDVNSVLAPTYAHADLAETTLTLKGLAVTASSHQSAVTNAATLGLGSSAGISLVPVVNILGGTTKAFIQDSRVGTRLTTFEQPEVYVNASSHAYAGAFVAGAAGSTGGAASGAAATNLMERKTLAYLSNATTGTLAVRTDPVDSVTHSQQRSAAAGPDGEVEESATPVTDITTTVTQDKVLMPTLGAVRVQATASQSAANVVAGFAAASGAFAGTGVVNRFSADTQAYVEGGSVSAGSLAVDARTRSGYNAVAGAGAIGATAGGAGSFVVGIANNSTRAWVGDAAALTNTTTLHLTGALGISADTVSSMNSLVISGAAGGSAGVAGMADVTLLNNTTVAGLYRTTAGETAPETPVESQATSTVTNGSGGDTTTTTITRDRTGSGQVGQAMGAVTIHASENVDIDARAGAGGGGGAAGVGAGANVVIVRSQVTGELKDSRVTTPAALSVIAGSVKDVDMVTASAGAGGTAGIGGAAGVLLIGDGSAAAASAETDSDGAGTLTRVGQYSHASPGVGSGTGLGAAEQTRLAGTAFDLTAAIGSATRDAVTAKVEGATITAGSTTVTASGAVSTSNTVGAGAAGTVGAGGAVGYTRVYDHITAAATGSTINAPAISVSALMGDNADPSVHVKAYAGAAGLVGLGAAVADGLVNNTVTATLAGTFTGGPGTDNTVLVSAQDLSSVSTEGIGAAAGAGAVGVVVSTADKQSSVAAQTAAGSSATGYKTVGISAAESGAVTASAIAAAAGIVAGTGAGASAIDRASVSALASGTLAASSVVNVASVATPDVSARALGVSVGGYSVGASVALATAAPTVTAAVGDAALVNGTGALAVTAAVLAPTGTNTADAHAVAGSGGALLGANATVAKASSDATVSASVGSGARVPQGDLSISAVNNTRQSASSTGVGTGYVALGANVAEAGSSGTTKAWLGSGAVLAAGRTGAVSIIASGTDENTAEATSGVGGMVAGNAAIATTSDTALTQAWIAGDATRNTLHGGDFLVNASHHDRSGRSASSVNASLAGASGAVALHSADSTVEASLGEKLTLNARGVAEVEASNTFTEDHDGDTASAAGGGAVSGAAAISRTTLTGTTRADFDNDVIVNSGTDPMNNPGGITATASTWASGNDQVTLATGGAITGAGTESSYDATFNNAVEFGTGNQLRTQGNIGAGTWTVTSVNTAALVNTWGLASVGSANARTDITTNQNVKVGGGSTLEAFGNVNLTAGRDPLGSYDTALSGSSNAQGYVKGIVAVPDADASTRLAANAAVDVDAGAQLRSGQNVTVGAYNGTPMGTSSAEGRGYQLYFIPVSAGNSSVSTPTSSRVDFDGSITAGVFHRLDIAINGNSLSYNSDAAPFLFSYDNSFHAPSYIAANYTGTSAQLLDSGVSQSNVGAFTLGTLYASGGTATLHADTLAGSGTVTSHGSPTISVVNNSPNYLLLNSAYIPNLPGGKVIFTGAAGRAQAESAGLGISEVGGSGSPSITINNAYGGTVGDGRFGPALFLNGAIENLGGSVVVNNSSGSLGQGSTIYGQQVNVTVPNGVAVITPASGIHYAGGNPYSEWYSYMLWPGGNPASGVPNAAQAMTYVINAVHNANGQYTTADQLTAALIGSAGSTNNRSVVYFGNCAPFALGDCSSGTADRLSPIGQHYNISGSGGSFAKVPVRTLSKTGSYAQANLTGSAASSQIYGGQVSIEANLIDINGKISAGRPTQWSLDLAASLTDPLVYGPVTVGYTVEYSGWMPVLKPVVEQRVTGGGALALFKHQYDTGKVTNPVFAIPGAVTRAGDSVIAATYNAKTNEISLEEVRASSGGGYVRLKGKIISTNPLGNIHVNGGLGDVQVVNNTGLQLNLNKINAGNAALASALVSEVEIIDKNRSAASNHWLYSYTPGSGLRIYQGAESQSKQQLLAGAYSTGASAATRFDPVAGLRWEWRQTASLSRPFSGDYKNWTYGNWTFDGNQNNPWLYTDQFGGSASTTPKGYLLSGQDNSVDFRQQITGTSNYGKTANIHYHGCDSSSCNYGFNEHATSYTNSYSHGERHAWWQYRYPTSATLTLTSSVKASNSFGIDFSGNSRGSIQVNSNAPVVVNNALVNPNGTTAITASRGGISESATGSVLTNDLQLSAQGGIGSAERALGATLTADGVLSAIGGSQGVYLDLNSAARVNSVRSQTGSAYGDVVIRAAGSLVPVNTGAPNVTGNNITLASQLGGIGSEAAPLVLAARPGLLANGLVSGGVVNVSALNDIGITQTGGNLLVGSIGSTAGGNVYVNVPNGTIYGAAGQTAAQALSEDQVRQIWQDLKLTAAYGAESNVGTAPSVVRFQNQVDSQYQQYWRLRAAGTVVGDSFTLDAGSLALYRPLAAAALGIAQPSDAQVQAYASGQYQSVTTALQNLLGADWTTVVGSAPVSNFAYVATQAQIDALTARAVWTEAELNAAINGSALQPGTPVGIGEPNISGRDVKLVTSGAIGKLAAPITITLADLQSGSLTPAQAAALALASAPGTVTAVDANGVPVVAGVQPHAFQIQQTAPVFVNATGKFSAQAGGQAYVQSTGQTIALDRITAGGNVSVTAPQSILNAGTSPVQIVTPGEVTLLAGGGHIGSAASPLAIQAGRLLSASAGQDAYIRGLGGDLTFGRVVAGGLASLDAAAGSLFSYLDGVVVQGHGIRLDALGDVGSASRHVRVQVDASGTLDGTAGGTAYIEAPGASSVLKVGTYSADAGLHLVAAGDLEAQDLRSSQGEVNASAGGSASIAAVNGGISTAGSGDVTLTAVADLTVGSVANTSGSVTLQAGDGLTVTGAVTTGSGAIDATAATVDIAPGGELATASGTVTVAASGNVYVNRIASGKTNGQAITVTSSAGRILEAGADPDADIVAKGTGAVVTLSARDGIGDATRTGAASFDTATPNALETDVAALDAASAEGAIHLSEADALVIGSVVAKGRLQLAAGGALTGTLAQSSSASVGITAASVDLATVSAGTWASLATTAGTLQVGSASAGGALTLQGQAGIGAGSLATTGPGGISATATTGDVAVSTVDSAGAVTLTAQSASGDIRFDTVQGLGDVAFSAGRSVAGRSASRFARAESLGGSLTADAGSNIAGDLASAAGNVQLAAGQALDVDAVDSTTGSVQATGADLTIRTTSAGTTAALAATTGNARVASVQGAGQVTVSAGQAIEGLTAGTRAGTVRSTGAGLQLTAAAVNAGLLEARTNLQVTAGSIDVTTASALDGSLAATSTTGGMTLGSANAGTGMVLVAQAGITATTLTTDAGALQATAHTGDVTITTADSGGAATITATTGHVKVDTVEASGDVAVTAAQAIGGRSAARYDRIESLGGKVTLTARGGNVTGNVTRGAGDVQLTGSDSLDLTDTQSTGGALAVTAQGGSLTLGSANAEGAMNLSGQTGITATTLTTDAGPLQATAQTGDVTITTADSAGAAAITATTGHVKVDTAEATGDVTVTAAQAIGGRSAARYDRIESLGGKVTLTAQGGNVTGNLTRGAGDVQLTGSDSLDLMDTQSTGGALAVTAQGGSLTLGSANAETGMALTGQTGITATTLTTDAGALQATAQTGDVTITTADSAGAATLTATTGHVKVDTVEASGDVAVTAAQAIGGRSAARYDRIESLGGKVTLTAQGGDVTGNVTRGAGDVQLTGSDSLDLTDTQSTGGALAVTAQGGSLTLGSANAEGAMNLSGQTGITATTLTTDAGNLQATAHTGDVAITTAASAGALQIAASTGQVKLDTAEARNAVAITAAQSIGGRTSARYGRIESLAGDVTLVAQGGDITGNQTTAHGSASLTASQNLDLVRTQATTGTATLLGRAGDVKLDTLQGQGDVTVTAGEAILGSSAARYQRIESLGGKVTLTARGGNVTGNATRGAGDVQLTASDSLDLADTQSTGGALAVTAQGGSIAIGSANAEGAMNLSGQTGITATTLTTDAGPLQATAHSGDVTITTADSAGAATLTAGTGHVKVDTVEATGDVTVTAAQSIAGRSAPRYQRIESLSGRVTLNAGAGDITGDLTRGVGDVQLVAGNGIDGTTVASTGASLSARTGASSIVLGSANAQVDATLVSAADVVFGSVAAATGNVRLQAQNDITGNLVDARAGDATLDAVDGAIRVGSVRGGGVLVYAKDRIVGETFEVGRRLVLVSDSVDASVVHTQASPVLHATLVGRYQPVMSSVKLTVNSSSGVMFDRFWSQDASLLAPTGTVELTDAYIGNRLLVTNPQTRLLMDNSSPAVQNPYDAQLFSRTKSFALFLDRNSIRTQGADIIHRKALTHTVLSESTGLDSSVAEISLEEQARTLRLAQPPQPPAIRAVADVVRFTGTPVMMRDLGPSPGGGDAGGESGTDAERPGD